MLQEEFLIEPLKNTKSYSNVFALLQLTWKDSSSLVQVAISAPQWHSGLRGCRDWKGLSPNKSSMFSRVKSNHGLAEVIVEFVLELFISWEQRLHILRYVSPVIFSTARFHCKLSISLWLKLYINVVRHECCIECWGESLQTSINEAIKNTEEPGRSGWEMRYHVSWRAEGMCNKWKLIENAKRGKNNDCKRNTVKRNSLKKNNPNQIANSRRYKRGKC